ncbi:UDP-N-acetylglucosamine 1-carboxyvinyltransferase [Streptococcus gordonii]|nr:UDP-N-acetylglucosamine 1-carboxyvinyltransferase [Streptococcus gordonii]
MIVGSNPSTALYYLIYQEASEHKARKIGLFSFHLTLDFKPIS